MCIRKIYKYVAGLWGQANSRPERVPPSLAECLDNPVEARRQAWRFWLIFFLILPTFYYIQDLFSLERSRFLSRKWKHIRLSNQYNVTKDIGTSSTEFTTKPIVVTMVNYEKGMQTENHSENVLNTEICELERTQLGKFSVRKPPRKIFLENQYPTISKGGYYSPVGCRSRHKVGILVPYRDREENLEIFLYNIHPFLMKQKLEYRIFIVEQNGTDKFNKGRLYNAGFKEMKKFVSWQCIVFHDVDLIPLDERILYSCPFWPRHMCATVVEKVNDPTYRTLFGGVTSMTSVQYEKVNGYSNLYWGWGGEDNDMFWRLRYAKCGIVRYNKTIARYTSLPHPQLPPNPLRYNILRSRLGKYKEEGLSTLEYKLVSITEKHLYTHIIVNINPNDEKSVEYYW